jgi:hypothetical protein
MTKGLIGWAAKAERQIDREELSSSRPANRGAQGANCLVGQSFLSSISSRPCMLDQYLISSTWVCVSRCNVWQPLTAYLLLESTRKNQGNLTFLKSSS